ncbi:hypothetical protein COL32_27635 [Bacillus pseudomycoides]|uniref:hypothetical protein n=1 Tax=Bacillus pseudomycoides TaxID=64104 RepID=UPI000BF82C2C|nr:hypothetical protein [Bacillus pseudomycoides]PFW87237.1 hypothetical protein COL29_29790 [Bacillus pseudomycoides]PFX37063.1 hypothetical protein COL32_27635 [Bacillus pseudomycoides]
MNDNTMMVTASEIRFVNGGKVIVTGKVRLFNTNERENLLNPIDNYFNINNVLSVKPIDIEVCNECGEIVEEIELYSDDRLFSKQKICPKCNLKPIPPLKK